MQRHPRREAPRRPLLVRARRRRVRKVVSFFLFRYRSGSVRNHDHEVLSAALGPTRRGARTLLSYRGRAGDGRAAMARIDPRPCSLPVRVRTQLLLAVFIDQLKRGRKTATIRLGDKSSKYRKGHVVLVTVGFQHSPRERIFEAVIDSVEVKRVSELSPRDIEHDNPEFRRARRDDPLPRADLRPQGGHERRRGHRRPLLRDLGAPVRDHRAAAPGRARPELAPGAAKLIGRLALQC